MISCKHCPLRDLDMFVPMTGRELSFMERFKSGELEVEAGATLMLEGATSPHMYTPIEGMGLRYKTLETGKRQVINFVFPGDFIGLQAGLMKEMQHSVEASTPMKLCVFNRSELWTLFEHHPERAYDPTWISAVEEHLLGESLAIVGHMSGKERVARALVRVHDRAFALGMVKENKLPLPYRQQDLADAIGLSLVHTNKTLQKLKDQGVAAWQDGVLHVKDYEGLCKLAKLDAKPDIMVRPLM
ncbi:CRP-like cAMP-binding protein [Maritalea mobilis]|uniref:CRP-like cAMP-binding protein n=2 Tax=Maritalea mobilis TaxID=483324 RepID=A0A4V3DB00_9HYPH|nr:CRP-like cAMP-binding protein [Maritalea mobilis]